MHEKIDYILGDFLPEPGTVKQIAEGVLWIRMPLPFALNHINLYLIEDDDGWVAIDSGIADDVTRGLWTRILEEQLAPRSLKRLIVTHFHPDHLGLATWLLDRTGAEFWISREEWLSARSSFLDDTTDTLDEIVRFYRRAGLPGAHIDKYREIGNDYRTLMAAVPGAFQRITAETTFRIGGREWSVLIGAGHSPEHVCLHCPDLNLLIGGDMLLPRITPIIAVWPSEPDGNPLAEYLKFIRGLDGIAEDVLVLPAHDRPYRGLSPRLDALNRHHDERLDMTLQACAQPATAHDIMRQLFTREMDMHQMRFAIGESIAHANMLMHEGAVERALPQDGIMRFSRR